VDRSSIGRTPVAALVTPLLSLVWTRERGEPKHSIPRMPRAGNHRLPGTASLPLNRYPGDLPVLNPRY
jgi:hypothetical protein